MNDAERLVESRTQEIQKISVNEMADDPVKNYTSEKVKVWGTIRVEGDLKIITVNRFEAVIE